MSLSLIIAAVAGAVLLLDRAVQPHWDAWPEGPWSRPVRTAILLFAAVLAIPAHELGHAIAAKLAGLRTTLISIGPLMMVRSTGGEYEARWTWNLAQWGGLTAAVVAPGRSSHLDRRMAVFTAGGPAGSGLGGLLALVAYHQITADSVADLPLAVSGLAVGLLGFAALSLCLAVVTLIPSAHLGILSDGRRLVRLLRDGLRPDTRAQVLINAAMSDGRRPRSWPSELIETAAGSRDPGTLIFAYYACIDRGESAAAGRVLGRALEHVEAGSPMQAVLEAEAASFEARFRRDAVAARRWLESAASRRGSAEPATSRARALTIRLEGGDPTGALRSALPHIEGIASAGMAEFERDWLRGLTGEIGPGSR